VYLCRHCGKFSKSIKQNESSQPMCGKCQKPTSDPLIGGPHPQDRGSSQTSDLPPGFGSMIAFTSDPLLSEYRGVMVLKYPEPIDIPGTSFCYVLPMQDKVKKSIVEDKVKMIQSGELNPVVEVAKTDKLHSLTDDPNPGAGFLVLADNFHHTFVAALKVGVAVTLRLIKGGYSHPYKNWSECKYVEQF
jgi:hypothetical protein